VYKRSHQQLTVKPIHEAAVSRNRVTKILENVHTKHGSTFNVSYADKKPTTQSSTRVTASRKCQPPLPSDRQHPSYGDCLEVKGEHCQSCSVLGCVTQCSQSAAHLYEQFLQVQQIGFVTLGPLCRA